jgi:hypothetical protein
VVSFKLLPLQPPGTFIVRLQKHVAGYRDNRQRVNGTRLSAVLQEEEVRSGVA